MNAALPHTDGDLILVLDADHIPTADILENTVGQFVHDDRLFLVQTPHFFINADPIEKNLGLFGKMPGESEMYFRIIQRGLDFWNATLFAGSAALLRRKALEEIGGFATQTVTEDAETALELHARGWRSAFVSRPMVAGLAPETFGGFVVQRMRWAQGMVQIFLLRRPLTRPGLTFWQRLCYLSNCAYWFFPFARLVFLLAPTAYLFFGLKIYNANIQEIFVYVLPQFWAAMTLSAFLFGRLRWPFVSVLYEMLQSMYSIGTVWSVLRNPTAPKFKVTPKGEHLEDDFVSPLAWPFYIVLIVLLAGYPAAVFWWQQEPEYRHVLVTGLGWHSLNVLIMLAALGSLAERKQRREDPRMPADMPAHLHVAGSTVPGRLVDLSAGGTRIEVSDPAALDAMGGTPDAVEVPGSGPGFGRRLPLEVVSRQRAGGTLWLGCRFQPRDLEDRRQIVCLAFGDSERWLRTWTGRRGKPTGTVRGLVLLAVKGLLHSHQHVGFILRGTVDLGRRAARRAVALATRALELLAAPPAPAEPAAADAAPVRGLAPVPAAPSGPAADPEPDTPLAAGAPAGRRADARLSGRRSSARRVSSAQRGRRQRAGLYLGLATLAAALGLLAAVPAAAQTLAQSEPGAAPASDVADATNDRAGEGVTYTLALQELMADPGPIRMLNDRDDEDLFFPLSSRFELDQAALRLDFTNSIALLGERSQMRVLANGAVVAQVPLQGTQPNVQVEAFIEPDLLVPGFNTLRFETAQHYTIECEDPGAPELWTQIDTRRSSLSLQGRLQPVEPLLSELDRLISPALGSPTRYDILTPSQLSAEDLGVGALVAQAISLRLDYRPGQFDHRIAAGSTPEQRADWAGHPLSGLDQTALGARDGALVGTRDALARYLDDSLVRQITGPYLGVFARADDPRYLMLLVTGRDDAEVEEAAKVLGMLDFPLADAAASRVDLGPKPGRVHLGGRPRIEPGRSYDWADLGYSTTSLKGANPQGVTVEFDVPPDFYVSEDASVRLSLSFAYGARLRNDSVLNVYLNERFERALPLDSPSGAVLRDYAVYIPMRSFEPGRNVIEAEAVMVPSRNEDCVTAQSDNLLITLFDTSWIEFPDTAHYAEQPNLDLFADTGFPYLAGPDGSGAPFFLLSSLDSRVAAAAWTLAGKLAQMNDGPLLDAGYGLAAPNEAAHTIAIGPLGELDPELLRGTALSPSPDGLDAGYAVRQTDGRPSDFERIKVQMARLLGGDPPARAAPAQVRVRQSAVPQRYGVALAFQSPQDPGRLVTLFTALDAARLQTRMEEIVAPERWGQLNGDLALWRGDLDEVSWQRAHAPFFVGELGLLDFLRYHLSAQPLYWVGGVLVTILLLAFLTQRLLIRLGRKIHGRRQILDE
jgi:hypothetical protein